MEMSVKIKKSKLEKIVTNSSNQLKSEKYKKIESKQIQKIHAKTKNLLAFCPFCSSDESFNRNKMRCIKCGTIVTQIKDYELLVSKL